MIPRRRYNLERGFLHDALTGTGGAVARFESALASLLGSPGGLHVRATASGRAALAILLSTLDVPRGSTIMLPAYTLGAMGPFVESLGYRWMTCDVDSDRPVMTARTVAEAWPSDASVRCVLPTHLFGIPADVPEIARFAHAHGAVVIEDCAHSIGATLDGVPTGTLGDAALFSFNYLKPVNCFGGGAAVIQGKKTLPALPDQPLIEVAAMFASGVLEDLVFAGPWLRVPTAMLAFDGLSGLMRAVDSGIRRPAGQKFACQAMSSLQALHGLSSLATFPDRLRRRRASAFRICTGAGMDASLWREGASSSANAYFLTVRSPEASLLRRRLWLNGIDAGTGTEVADYLECPGCPDRPSARHWFQEAVQIPCHESLSDRDVEKIAKIVGKYLSDR